jgi:hypothetical protein
MKSKQERHIFGVCRDGRLPIIRINGAPTPLKGAAQSWHRGSLGILR